MSTLAAKSWRAKILSTGAVVIASVLASAHAVHAHRAHREAMTHVTHWQTVAEAAISASPGEGPRRVMINGAEVLVEKHTTLEGLEQVFAAAHAQCQSGDEGVALGLGASSDGVAHPIRLARITTTVADPSREDRASLCIFEKEAAGPPRIRYTSARREADSTSVTTISTLTTLPPEVQFPEAGDAPGSDDPSIARPASSRRVFTIVVSGAQSAAPSPHTLRVYDSSLSVDRATESYDRDMEQRGFSATAGVDGGRMYRKGDRSYAVTFQKTPGGSTVTLTPFET